MSTVEDDDTVRPAEAAPAPTPRLRTVEPPPPLSLTRALWRERWAVLGCVVVAALAGALLGQLQTPQYTARARVFLSAQGEFDPLNRGQAPDVGRFVQSQVALMGSTPVLTAAITALDLDTTAPRLGQDLRITGSDDSTVVVVRATADDPAEAKRIADAIPSAYRAYVRQRVAARAGQAVDAATQADDTATAAAVRTAQAVYGDGVGSVEAAAQPRRPSSPQPLRNGLLLGLLGLFVGSGYALYTQSAARRRVSPAEAAAWFEAPLLGEIPDRGRLDQLDVIAPANSAVGDAYRMAAVALDYIRGAAPGVFLLTAAHDGAGAGTTALNLAAAAADHGRKVFLLSVEDTVRPAVDADPGSVRVPLHELAQGRVDLGHAVERRASRARFGIIRLQVQQPVQGHPVADVQQILEQLPDDTDLVLFDVPPLPASSASFVLAGQVDAAVVVVDDVTTPADLDELQRRCRLAGIPVAGVLSNHVRPRPGEAGRRGPQPVLDAEPGARGLEPAGPTAQGDLAAWGRPATVALPETPLWSSVTRVSKS